MRKVICQNLLASGDIRKNILMENNSTLWNSKKCGVWDLTLMTGPIHLFINVSFDITHPASSNRPASRGRRDDMRWRVLSGVTTAVSWCGPNLNQILDNKGHDYEQKVGKPLCSRRCATTSNHLLLISQWLVDSLINGGGDFLKDFGVLWLTAGSSDDWLSIPKAAPWKKWCHFLFLLHSWSSPHNVALMHFSVWLGDFRIKSCIYNLCWVSALLRYRILISWRNRAEGSIAGAPSRPHLLLTSSWTSCWLRWGWPASCLLRSVHPGCAGWQRGCRCRSHRKGRRWLRSQDQRRLSSAELCGKVSAGGRSGPPPGGGCYCASLPEAWAESAVTHTNHMDYTRTIQC